MNPILERKLDELKKLNNGECWYIVKQQPDFGLVCYLVSFLEEYINSVNQTSNLEDYVNKRIEELKAEMPDKKNMPENYRSLRIAAYYGLIHMTNDSFSGAIITDTFEEITDRCNGEYEKTDLYLDIIQRQIEKIYISSPIDDKYNNNRQNYRLYPVMFLYKILLEIGHSTGSYSITFSDYSYIVATTTKYENFLDTLLLIKLLHEDDSNANEQFEKLKSKFDNRFIRVLKQLQTIDVDKNKKSISLEKDFIDEVSNKVFIFESNPSAFYDDKNYFDFLGSTQSMLDLYKADFNHEYLTPEWFNYMAAQPDIADNNEKVSKAYNEFKENFGSNTLELLSGDDLLNKMFPKGNKEDMCYMLENKYGRSRNLYGRNLRGNNLFGAIEGGSQGKYPLSFDDNSRQWKFGQGKNTNFLSSDEAIKRGTSIRDQLVNCVHIIEDKEPFETVDDYIKLGNQLDRIMHENFKKIWALKYFHMLFPDIIPPFYTEGKQNEVIKKLGMQPDTTTYGRLGQIALYVGKCKISSSSFLQVYDKYCTDNSICGYNKIYYGIPGCGKSYYIEHTVLEGVNKEKNVFRTTFYLDYSNSDFIGQIYPQADEEGNVTYDYKPGPFTSALERAYRAYSTDEMVYLVIEEINRGNAAAILGDTFQLLDRLTEKFDGRVAGDSEYPINNQFIEEYLKRQKVEIPEEQHKIFIPHNLTILATMNTSDQNVFPLDTAFKRRWQRERVVASIEDCEFKDNYIPYTDVTWNDFVTGINYYIITHSADGMVLEDKQMGPFFASKDMFIDKSLNDKTDEDSKKEKNNALKKFVYNVIDYLYNDVCKFDKEYLFKGNISFNAICEYAEKGENIIELCFKDRLFDNDSKDGQHDDVDLENQDGNGEK